MNFSELAIGFVIAAAFGYLLKIFKQPLLVGYLFAGIFIGATGILGNAHNFDELGKVGVTLLLFLLGLEMNLKELPSIGKTALFTGLGQIAFTTTIGLILSLAFGYSLTTSLYFGLALSFSSTIIMVKLLSDKNDLGSLYGRISVGFLLVQDFVAIFLLIILSSVGKGDLQIIPLIFTLIKMVVVVIGVYMLSRKIIVNIFEKYFSQPIDLLFVVSIAWALGISVLVGGPLGFTIEIGGFLAGLALSNLPEHLQIVSKTKPLRDFFLILFFIYLGSQLVFDSQIVLILPKAFFFSILVLVGNPLIVLTILGLMGYKKRTSFLSGLTVAQISEFSFIVMAVGAALGHVGGGDVTLIFLVGVITMTISTYLIANSENIYQKLKNKLNIFEREHPKEKALFHKEKDIMDHVVLLGCDRTGSSIHNYLKTKNITHLVVDYNPKTFNRLVNENANVLFGDVEDLDILSVMNLQSSRMLISTIGILETNLIILNYLITNNIEIIKIFKALTREDALKLYESGADYVIVPEVAAGDHLKHMIIHNGFNTEKYFKIGKINYDKLLSY